MKPNPAIGQRWQIENYLDHPGRFLIVEIEGPQQLRIIQMFQPHNFWSVGSYLHDSYSSLLTSNIWFYLEGQDKITG